MFADYIKKEQEELKLSDREMSQFLKVSVPTIDRWKRGVSIPHPLAEKSIREVLGMMPTLLQHKNSDNETIRDGVKKILGGDYELMDDDLD